MNILITGAWKQAQTYIDKIESLGHNVVFLQYEKEALPCTYEWVEAVVCNGLFLHHEIKKFKNLKYIQLTSAGYDRVPMKYVKENNISIYNAAGVYSIPMAEYAICMSLYLYKQIAFFQEKQKQCIWEKNRNLLELNLKNVCILGCGNVGMECAKRFEAFNCKVTGISDVDINSEYFEQIYKPEKLNNIIKNQDILIVCLPLTQETYHMINMDILSKMKDASILINISRGAVVDTNALHEVLKEKNMYAILDVFEEEPLPSDSLLYKDERIIITPHNSFVGDNVDNRLSELIYSKLELK